MFSGNSAQCVIPALCTKPDTESSLRQIQAISLGSIPFGYLVRTSLSECQPVNVLNTVDWKMSSPLLYVKLSITSGKKAENVEDRKFLLRIFRVVISLSARSLFCALLLICKSALLVLPLCSNRQG